MCFAAVQMCCLGSITSTGVVTLSGGLLNKFLVTVIHRRMMELFSELDIFSYKYLDILLCCCNAMMAQSLTQENAFEPRRKGRVPWTPPATVEGKHLDAVKNIVCIIVRSSFHWSSFGRCFFYNKPKVKIALSSNHTHSISENIRSIWHA